MKSRTIGLALVGIATAGALYWWWKRRQPTNPNTSPAVQKLIAGGGATAAAIQAALGDFSSWAVAPAQPATPNTPTVDPVFSDVRGGSSTNATGASQAAASRGAYF